MISVIVPTRSRYNTLKHTIEAIANQNTQDFELIISDDNSTDETQSLISQYKDRLKLKYIFNNHKDHGTWNASIPRNLGALVADPSTKGYYFVDSDVSLPPTAVQHVIEDFNLNPNRVIIGPYHWYNKDHDGISQQDIRWPKFEEVTVDQTFATVHDGLACFGGNIFFPKDIFWRVGGFSPEIEIGLEDGDMGLKLWKAQTNFSYDKRLLGAHRWHEIPSDRFPSNMRQHIDNLNLKHFHTTNPDYGIVEASRETYASWGVQGWEPPQSWLENKLDMTLKVNA